MAWDSQNLKKILAAIGDVVEVDDEVEELRKMDRVRILVKTPWKPLIQHTVRVCINGEIFPVCVIEEGGSYSHSCRCRLRATYSSSEDICSEESELRPLPESTQSWINAGSQHAVVSEEWRDMAEEQKPAEEGDMQGEGEQNYHQVLPVGCEPQGDPLVISSDQGTKVRSRYSDDEVSPDTNASQNGAAAETRDAGEVPDRSELRIVGDNGLRTPDRKRGEEHAKGKMRAEESGSDFEVAELNHTHARDKEHVDLVGLVLLPHTPSIKGTYQGDNKIEAHSNQKHPSSVYVRKKWRKRQITENGLQRSMSVVSGNVSSQQGMTNGGHKQDNIQQQHSHQHEMDQYMQQEELQAKENSKEAEILWQLAKELGVTGWNDNTKQVQQLGEMEQRDIKESERLGGMRKSP